MNAQSRSIDGDTRREVMLLLLKLGPSTAGELGEHLGLSAAGVRRHLDILVEEHLAENCEPPAITGQAPSRGRPAKTYRLTEHGREEFGHNYDHLALQALESLRQFGGDEAVRALAKSRIETILEGVEPAGESDDSVEETTRELAEVLDRHGYAATVTRAGMGIQICQHHCPVASVAAEHPELCEAEHEAISEIVGVHVQPLASIADGNGICTTNIPLVEKHLSAQPQTERSGS
ncbi:transcriptional regulator [Corynebacterium breve]|uniref:Transcriptional regulator n=1 Tax=Corynebacterium breve TaxID=3049799 RepID=A0ABY8VGT3_9CORY|nr:metalloregulator ArsR/SmtB family transcription factor [Corynebacterium breve]WIM68881.1 transcriptional regulator [Corynebacterium breve]